MVTLGANNSGCYTEVMVTLGTNKWLLYRGDNIIQSGLLIETNLGLELVAVIEQLTT